MIAILKEGKKTFATDVLKIIFGWRKRSSHASRVCSRSTTTNASGFADGAAIVEWYNTHLILLKDTVQVFCRSEGTHDLELDVSLSDLHEGELPDTYFLLRSSTGGILVKSDGRLC